ncbi:hypothetical protein E2320_003831 [Naja naja]|nr:hypothetical protein E2320_003831 [Naja naja]
MAHSSWCPVLQRCHCMGVLTGCFPRRHFALARAEQVSRPPLQPTGSSSSSSSSSSTIVRCPSSEVHLDGCTKEELLRCLRREEAEAGSGGAKRPADPGHELAAAGVPVQDP